MKGLFSIRRLAICHPEIVLRRLNDVSLAVTKEVRTLCLIVSHVHRAQSRQALVHLRVCSVSAFITVFSPHFSNDFVTYLYDLSVHTAIVTGM